MPPRESDHTDAIKEKRIKIKKKSGERLPIATEWVYQFQRTRPGTPCHHYTRGKGIGRVTQPREEQILFSAHERLLPKT